jgi:hypothetical protein
MCSKFLIIDDNIFNILAIEMLLKSELKDFPPSKALSGKEALSKI